ncbi:MAG: HAMP domain-containing protein, partial [bacterium]|nr:HAMP domain-containing protein [bacterium]
MEFLKRGLGIFCVLLVLMCSQIAFLHGLVVKPLNHVVNIAVAVANGNFDQQLDTHRTDEIGLLVATFRDMADTINCVLQELHRIIQQTQAGHLKFRGNAAIFKGNWHDLVVGINQVIDAFVAPMTMTATALRQIARGNIPPEITDAYNGDFNAIR